MVAVHDTTLSAAKNAGELLASSASSDVVDALVALQALPGDQLLTSDVDDLTLLTAHRPVGDCRQGVSEQGPGAADAVPGPRARSVRRTTTYR